VLVMAAEGSGCGGLLPSRINDDEGVAAARRK